MFYHVYVIYMTLIAVMFLVYRKKHHILHRKHDVYVNVFACLHMFMYVNIMHYGYDCVLYTKLHRKNDTTVNRFCHPNTMFNIFINIYVYIAHHVYMC